MVVSGYSSLVAVESECGKNLPDVTEVAQHRDLWEGLDQDQRGRHQHFIFVSGGGVS
jgi:hypothetical protein